MIVQALGIDALFGYLAGSIPFGLILTRLAGLEDVRRIGSGSIGATNVLRTGRKDIAALTLLLDGGKGTFAAFYAYSYTGDYGFMYVAGLFAVIGHCANIWLLGRGGKGVATGLGVFLAWAWPVFLVCGALWLATAYLSRRSSLAGIVAFAAAPVVMLLLESRGDALFVLLVSLVVIVRHHSNIRRLIAGTEPRIGAKG